MKVLIRDSYTSYPRYNLENYLGGIYTSFIPFGCNKLYSKNFCIFHCSKPVILFDDGFVNPIFKEAIRLHRVDSCVCDLHTRMYS